MRLLLSFTLLLCISSLADAFSKSNRTPKFRADPEEHMNAVEMIEYWGYPAQEWPVITQDGYILRIQRIPHGRSGPSPSGTQRPVIFFQHGLECSSTNWIANLPNESAAFVFADAGFDVWLGNMRGNTYGLGHVHLTTRDKKFWEFSWDEMSKYDLEAMIDFALNKTNQSQLYYAGHSQGTLTAFAKFSDDVPFSKKIKKYFALAPVVTVSHIEGALKYIAPFTNTLGNFLEWVGYNEFLPNDLLMDLLAKYVCGWVDTNPLCDNLLFLIGGPNSKQLNETRVPVYVAHTPAGTSTQNVIHFGQMVNSGKFQKFDYGCKSHQNNNDCLNYVNYGQKSPPLYDLSKSTVRTILFAGDNDWLGDLDDIAESILPVLHNYEYILCKDFNHLDFIWGMRATPVVYQKMLQIIKDEDGILL